ncbi:MAG: FadR family transcriptional regulator [Bacteroidales bacterium]|nr:FadR family transcriptional regulator [Bacteroidales bacterium]
MNRAVLHKQDDHIAAILDGMITLLDAGRLIPGERIPSERRLAEMLGVSRSNVRLALQRMEFYGILRTYPQSGSVLADYSPSVLRNQIREMREAGSFDFRSLVSVRVLLEKEAIRRCATLRTEEDLLRLERALADFQANMETPLRDEKDLAFHLTIAKASHNPVIASLLLTITPEVLKYYRHYSACAMPAQQIYLEHKKMLDCIRAQDADAAGQCIEQHFQAITRLAEKVLANVPRIGI